MADSHMPPNRRPRFLRRVGRWVGYGVLWALVVLALFEITYRYQVVDTYRPELRTYNTPAVLENAGTRPTVLIMGDSFTAGTFSYAERLRALAPSYRVINAGVSGTGVAQANVMAPRRFEEFEPSIFIYQIYVGNDLINVRYPINWRTASPLRNIYGLVIGPFRSIYFLNYRLGQLRHQFARPMPRQDRAIEAFDAPFAVESYSPLQRRYLRADPWILEDQILVQGGRTEDFATFLRGVEELLAHCAPTSCTAYLLVIPHASQVHPRYLENMRALGARFRHPQVVSGDGYPFLSQVSRAFAATPAVHVLDPMPLLRTHEEAGRTMFFSNDGHLNAEGQAAVATFLEAQVEWE